MILVILMENVYFVLNSPIVAEKSVTICEMLFLVIDLEYLLKENYL